MLNTMNIFIVVVVVNTFHISGKKYCTNLILKTDNSCKTFRSSNDVVDSFLDTGVYNVHTIFTFVKISFSHEYDIII